MRLPEIYLNFELIDRQDEVVIRRQEVGHSWVRNAYNMCYASVAGFASDFAYPVISTAGVMLTNSSLVTLNYSTSYLGLLNNSTYGIVVGTSNNAFSVNNYTLGALIPSSDIGSSGALLYSTMSKKPLEYDFNNNLYVTTHNRVFNNNSGAPITIKEVGMIGVVTPSSGYALVSRDVLSSPITIPDGGRLSIDIIFKNDMSVVFANNPNLSGLTYCPLFGTGYFGEVAAADFITGNDLFAAIGGTGGTPLAHDSGWLKFYFEGKTLYIGKTNFRTALSWNYYYNLGAVFGTPGGPGSHYSTDVGPVNQNASVVIGGNTYLVKFITGNNIINTHWRSLMYRVSTSAPSYFNNLTFWASLSASDLGLLSVASSWSLCQELSGTGAVIVGYDSVDRPTSVTTKINTGYSWRPCLELVE
jgi:hypothetical protein